MRTTPVVVEVLSLPGCPGAPGALSMAQEIGTALAPGVAVRDIRLTEAEAKERGFSGSPTVLVNGRDIEGREPHAAGVARRACETGGVPPAWMLEAAIVRVLAPRHILFLCVQNSARSQLAEGIARFFAPPGVRISSAGSAPAFVRPQAIRVLKEIGIDISAHRSKAIEEIDSASVEAVVTLCAEEVCPVFLGSAVQVHWGLPDPAKIPGDEAARLEGFRMTRDELLRRLKLLFDGWERNP